MIKAERPEDLELEDDIQEDFDPFEDEFEEQDASYQVWMLGYDADQNITDFSEKLFESKDPERAVNFAKAYVSGCDIENKTFPNGEKYVEVLVETIVDVEGVETNVGNLFDEYIEIEKI